MTNEEDRKESGALYDAFLAALYGVLLVLVGIMAVGGIITLIENI